MFVFSQIMPQKCLILGQTAELCSLLPILTGPLHLSSVRLYLFTLLSIDCGRRQDMNTDRKPKLYTYKSNITMAVLSPTTAALNVNVWKGPSQSSIWIFIAPFINVLFNQDNSVHEPKFTAIGGKENEWLASRAIWSPEITSHVSTEQNSTSLCLNQPAMRPS